MAEVFLDGSGPLDKLIEELDAMYPQFNPGPDDDYNRVLYRSGQRSVVEYIKSKLET